MIKYAILNKMEEPIAFFESMDHAYNFWNTLYEKGTIVNISYESRIRISNEAQKLEHFPLGELEDWYPIKI